MSEELMREGGWRTGDETDRIHPTVIFYADVRVGTDVSVYPYSVIGRNPQGAGTVSPTPSSRPTIIGDGTVIGANVTIYAGFQCGPECLIGDGVVIREGVTLGAQAIIGQNATIQPRARIGDRSRVLDLSHVTADVVIGNDVFWSVNVLSLNDNSMNQGGVLVAPAVGNGARIGAGAILLPGRQIGSNAVVAAGAVVTHDVLDHQSVRGIPARPKRIAADKSVWKEDIDFYEMFGGANFDAAKTNVNDIIRKQAAPTSDD